MNKKIEVKELFKNEIGVLLEIKCPKDIEISEEMMDLSPSIGISDTDILLNIFIDEQSANKVMELINKINKTQELLEKEMDKAKAIKRAMEKEDDAEYKPKVALYYFYIDSEKKLIKKIYEHELFDDNFLKKFKNKNVIMCNNFKEIKERRDLLLGA